MFGIHRQNRGAVLLCQLVDQFSRHHERLLIGKRNGFLRTDGIDGRLQSGITYHCRKNHVHRSGFHDLTDRIDSGIYFDRKVAQCFFQFGILFFIGYHYHFRLELACLCNQQFDPVVGCQGISLVQVGMFFDDLQRLRPDRARRA